MHHSIGATRRAPIHWNATIKEEQRNTNKRRKRQSKRIFNDKLEFILTIIIIIIIANLTYI